VIERSAIDPKPTEELSKSRRSTLQFSRLRAFAVPWKRRLGLALLQPKRATGEDANALDVRLGDARVASCAVATLQPGLKVG